MTYKTKAEAYEASSRYKKIKDELDNINIKFENQLEELKKAKTQVKSVKSNFESYYQSNSQLRNGMVKKIYDLITGIDSAEKKLNNIISQIDSNASKSRDLSEEAMQQFVSFEEGKSLN